MFEFSKINRKKFTNSLDNITTKTDFENLEFRDTFRKNQAVSKSDWVP